jgi:hypothetical protein
MLVKTRKIGRYFSDGAFLGATRKRQGWTRSDVFGHNFRLTRSEGADGFPAFTLKSRVVGQN